MARHRDVRNRQFSYDEGGDEDFYDEEEEDRLIEEHRLQTLQARGETGGRGGGSGGISLSSYFDDLPGSTPQLQQQQQQQPRRQKQQRVYDGSGGPGPPAHSRSDQQSAAGGAEYDAAADEDAELIAAIAAELENRLGKGRFSVDQVRRAVKASGYEVDTAEAILLSGDETSSSAAGIRDEPQVQTATGDSNITTSNKSSNIAAGGGGGGRSVAPPPGLPPPTGASEYDDNNSLSSLAFGLCVDGRPGAANTNTAGGGGGVMSSSSTTGISAATAAAAAGLERFDFDTPSPDDVNLIKQAAARGGGIGSKMSGSISGNGGGGGRKTDGAAFSSPKAKVLHISGSTPKTTSGRKTVTPGTPSTAAAAATAATPTPTKSRVQSPTTGNGISSPSPQRSAAAEAAALAIDESDDALAGGKERLAMVVIGHVDAGKSTLMGQVTQFACTYSLPDYFKASYLVRVLLKDI